MLLANELNIEQMKLHFTNEKTDVPYWTRQFFI